MPLKNWKLAFQWYPHPGGSSLPSSTGYITSKNQGGVPGLIWYNRGGESYGVTTYKRKNMTRNLFLVLMMLSFIGCTNSGEIKIGNCSFLYDVNIHGQIIMPVLEKKASGYAQYFNVSSPLISKKDGVVRVLLSPLNTGANETILYENSFVFLFDPCSGNLVDYFEVVRN